MFLGHIISERRLPQYTNVFIQFPHLWYKQHAVSRQRADKDGSCNSAVDQVGPGLQEEGHRDGHSGGQSDQSYSCYDGGRLVDRRMAHVTCQTRQIRPIEEKTTLKASRK